MTSNGSSRRAEPNVLAQGCRVKDGVYLHANTFRRVLLFELLGRMDTKLPFLHGLCVDHYYHTVPAILLGAFRRTEKQLQREI
jgi:hypothetical protein